MKSKWKVKQIFSFLNAFYFWLIRMIFQTSGIRRCKIRGKKEKKGERETERGASLPDMFKHNNMTPNRPRKIGRVCAMCYYAQNKIKIFHGWSKIHTNLRKKGTKLSKSKSEKLKGPWFPHKLCFLFSYFSFRITWFLDFRISSKNAIVEMLFIAEIKEPSKSIIIRVP